MVGATWLLVAVGCSSTYRSMTVEEKREYLEALEGRTLDDVVERFPSARQALDDSVGYAILSNQMTKVPVVGAGEGIGVVLDRSTGERTYLRVTRFDVGGGLGTRKFRVVLVFSDPEALAKVASGTTVYRAGAEASAGAAEVDTDGDASDGVLRDGYIVYKLAEEGVSATWTVRLIHLSVLRLEE